MHCAFSWQKWTISTASYIAKKCKMLQLETKLLEWPMIYSRWMNWKLCTANCCELGLFLGYSLHACATIHVAMTSFICSQWWKFKGPQHPGYANATNHIYSKIAPNSQWNVTEFSITLERMINNRLVWFLERNKLITPLQCGFRIQHSTTDHLVHLEAFIQRQHAVAVFSTCVKMVVKNLKYSQNNFPIQCETKKARHHAHINKFTKY